MNDLPHVCNYLIKRLTGINELNTVRVIVVHAEVGLANRLVKGQFFFIKAVNLV